MPKRKRSESQKRVVAAKVATSAVFRSEVVVPDASLVIKRVRWSYTRAGITLPGLTDEKEGYIARKFLHPPSFTTPEIKTPVTSAAEGVPLKTTAFQPGPGPRGLHSQTLIQRMRGGRKKGNLLVAQVAKMVTLVQKHRVPLSAFSVVTRQARSPKVVTKKHVAELYRLDPGVAVMCTTLLNSKAIQHQFLAQKLIELELEPIAYELPVGGHEAATALDLLCYHRASRRYVPCELKVGSAEPFLYSKGMLRSPLGSFSNCLSNRYFIQCWLGAHFFKKTYPQLAERTTSGLLIRVSRHGGWHSTIPRALSQALQSAGA